MIIWVNVNGYVFRLQDLKSIDTAMLKIHFLDGNSILCPTESIVSLKEKLKKMNGVIWITV